jgi:hypothetical protein
LVVVRFIHSANVSSKAEIGDIPSERKILDPIPSIRLFGAREKGPIFVIAQERKLIDRWCLGRACG